MSEPARVLILDRDPAIVEAVQAACPATAGFRVAWVSDAAAAERLVRRSPPDLLIVPAAPADSQDLARVRALGSRPGLPLLLARGESDPEAPAGEPGPVEWLAWPLDPRPLRERLLSAVRLARAERALAEAREQVRRAEAEQLGQIVHLITELCDLKRPGAIERGDALAALTAQLAARFEIPDELRRDLELASRLSEVGNLVADSERAGSSPVGTEGWESACAGSELLVRQRGLEGAAELLRSVRENWDGTGRPGNFLRGQIPLRSRILRAGIDYLAAIDRKGATPALVLAEMMEHKGARYDPLVLVHLESLLTGEDLAAHRAGSRVLPIESLEAGMVLADDLYTASGIKLLSRGARLGPAALESIRRRHRAEPIHHGATVRQAG